MFSNKIVQVSKDKKRYLLEDWRKLAENTLQRNSLK